MNESRFLDIVKKWFGKITKALQDQGKRITFLKGLAL